MTAQAMADYQLTVNADSGYEGTTEGRCSSDQYAQALGALLGAPIDMVLHCPTCGLQHIDAPDTNYDPHYEGHMIWDNPPHRSHQCAGCGHIWRPADVPTNGVAAIKTKGKNDSPMAKPAPAAVEHRTPFDVVHGPRTVHGQIATGFVVGVRLPDMDVLLFGATVDEARAAAQRLGGEVFGESMIDKRAMLIREGQAT